MICDTMSKYKTAEAELRSRKSAATQGAQLMLSNASYAISYDA